MPFPTNETFSVIVVFGVQNMGPRSKSCGQVIKAEVSPGSKTHSNFRKEDLWTQGIYFFVIVVLVLCLQSE